MAQSTESLLPRAPLQCQPVSFHYCALRRLMECRLSAQVRDKVAVLGKEGGKLTYLEEHADSGFGSLRFIVSPSLCVLDFLVFKKFSENA